MSIAEVVATTSASLVAFSGLCAISNSLIHKNKNRAIFTTAVTASASSMVGLGAWGLTELVAQSAAQASVALAAVPHAAAVGGVAGVFVGAGVPLAAKLLDRLSAQRSTSVAPVVGAPSVASDPSVPFEKTSLPTPRMK